jgi:hypothetical protein
MKLALIIASALLIPTWAAQANPSERILGSYVCLNNPAPECRNSERHITPTFACINNPNPICRHPPRPRVELKPGTWHCRMNQNVECDNAIRYSVEDRESWIENFSLPRATSSKLQSRSR